jgi:hypothetical protein
MAGKVAEMTNENEDAGLYLVIGKLCDDYKHRPSINPGWIATEAMVAIEFPRSLHPVGYIGCHLQFRQIARSVLRRTFDPVETEQNDLFPETLQDRYPAAPKSADSEPQYVLLEHMTTADVRYNVARLRKEAEAKLKHADALEVWMHNKFGDAV